MQKERQIQWIIINDSTKKIRSCGVSNCRATLNTQPKPAGCSLIEFSGGVKGHFYINEEMRETNEEN